MYSKKDYLEYFQNISLKERDMIFSLYRILSSLEDKALIVKLKEVVNDEVRHYTLAQKIITEFMGAAFERRLWERKYILGEALLEEARGDKKIKARCIDMSFGGVCVDIESQESLLIGRKYVVHVKFFDGTTPINRTGTVRWARKINASLFACGLTFLDESENIHILPEMKNL